LNLLPVIGTTVAQGDYLNPATATKPVAVLGAAAAQRLGIDRVYAGERIWLGNQWFYVAGILKPAVLAPEIDSSVLIGYPAAERYLAYTSSANGRTTIGPPTEIYVRAQTSQVAAVQSVLAQTANPEAPNEVQVSQPSAALTARAEAKGAFNGLFLGLGAVALLVGAVGVANIMIISVLERRSEIGLRRALGATKGQIRTQFLSEAILLALLGGAAGVAAGALATIIYAHSKHWSVVIPTSAWAGGIGAATAIGAIAGLLPAIRAARLSPTEALRTA
jgi:putative ABC transport system permease protein